MTKKKMAGKHQQGVRMDESMEARVRKYADRLSKETGLEVSFSSAVRKLIEKGLEAS